MVDLFSPKTVAFDMSLQRFRSNDNGNKFGEILEENTRAQIGEVELPWSVIILTKRCEAIWGINK